MSRTLRETSLLPTKQQWWYERKSLEHLYLQLLISAHKHNGHMHYKQTTAYQHFL